MHYNSSFSNPFRLFDLFVDWVNSGMLTPDSFLVWLVELRDLIVSLLVACHTTLLKYRYGNCWSPLGMGIILPFIPSKIFSSFNFHCAVILFSLCV